MDTDLAQQAVEQALTGDWQKAVDSNKQILKANKGDVDALNRMARAYAELGDVKRAKLTAEKVLRIDPFNSIATKSLKKWKKLKKGETNVSGPSSAKVFLEEPGKTKIVTLLHLGAPKVLAKLDSGDEVKLVPRRHRVSVTTMDEKYIGRLTDDLASRLIKLIKIGNKYCAFVKSTDDNGVNIFIREIERAEKLTDIPSFSSEKMDYVSFTPPELVHKKDKRPALPEETEE